MTYDYQCTTCNHSWEETQTISSLPLTICPKCHTESVKRLISGHGAFILKGGGWYADGYGARKVVSG